MVEKVSSRSAAHGIENDIDTFASGKLSGRYEVSIARDKDNLIDLLFQSHRGHIKAQSHVDTLLHHLDFEILINRVEGAHKPSTHRIGLGNPRNIIVQPTKPQRHFTGVEQLRVDR